MLNRNAEGLFWTGRYAERAENHARLMDVFYHIQQENDTQEAQHKWSRLIDALGSRAAYLQHHEDFTEKEVLSFITLDRNYSNSVLSCITHARSNIRTLREKVPGEMWDVLNGFYLWLKDRQVEDILRESPFLFFKKVKEFTATFQGVQHSVMLRGNEWHFMQSGKYLERSENTARILQSVYLAADDEPSLSYTYLLGVLKSVSGDQAFRLYYSDSISVEDIGEFLIGNEAFPRSVHFCLGSLIQHLKGIVLDLPKDRIIRLSSKMKAELDCLEREDLRHTGGVELLQKLLAACQEIGVQMDKIFFRMGEVTA
jgi:uncharacterized alpha-E superfamily protein